MKVICINARGGNNGKIPPPSKLIEGEYYHVESECMANDRDGNKIPAYVLIEMPQGAWERTRFIPTSEIDEKEFERYYNTVKI